MVKIVMSCIAAMGLMGVLATSAAAQTIGQYDIQGTSPDGSTYTGILTWASQGNNT